MSLDPPPGDPHAQPGLLLRLIRDQRIAFLVVGAINTAVGFALFVGADRIVGTWVDAHVGTIAGSVTTLILAHVLGVISAFVLYRRFVFKVVGHLWRDLARFESVYLAALGVNVVALPLAVELGVARIVAQAVITVLLAAFSYVGHRHFSFRRDSPR